MAIVAWDWWKPKPVMKVSPPSPSNPPVTATPTLRSSQNEPIPPSPTPTSSSQLQKETLNNIITVDSSGKEINRRTVQVQYFIEDKISLPSDVKAIEMALIPKGKFMMGSNEYDSEKPIHEVNFANDFHISRYVVTQAQWFTVMGRDYDQDGFKQMFSALDNKFKGDNRPIVEVKWNDAKSYCSKLSALTGKNYRLPTESEWEYSCRAKTITPFYFGETITPYLANYSTYFDRNGTYREVTTDVGSFPPNEWGLYDMHGNV